jgi:nitrite reductase/ring-hydroxylating ferredoxin subunit
MTNSIKVAETTEIAPGTAKQVTVAGKTIAVFNLNGTFYAMDDACTHRGGPLSEGSIEGDLVTCPWHGANFNIKTGQVESPPAHRGVDTYRVVIQGSAIHLELP